MGHDLARCRLGSAMALDVGTGVEIGRCFASTMVRALSTKASRADQRSTSSPSTNVILVSQCSTALATLRIESRPYTFGPKW